jgi:hypothetical protein
MVEETHSDQSDGQRRLRAPHGLFVEEPTDASPEIDWSSWTLTEEDALPGSLEQWSVIQLFG